MLGHRVPYKVNNVLSHGKVMELFCYLTFSFSNEEDPYIELARASELYFNMIASITQMHC